MKYDLSIIIPFYNEEGNVRDVIISHRKVLAQKKINYEIVAVNNGSADATGKILEQLRNKRLKIVTVKKNVGFGNGLIQGFKNSRGTIVGYTCGDNEISPEVLIKVYNKLVEENLDICKVTRTLREYGPYRRLISAAYNHVFFPIFFGKIANDVNGYPKLMKRRCYDVMKLRSLDSFIDTELLVKAKRNKFTIGEVYSRYSKRKKGKSSVKFYIVLEFMKNIVLFKLNRKF